MSAFCKQKRRGIRYLVWAEVPVFLHAGKVPGMKNGDRIGLCSTAKDYATFLQMYLNEGELNGIHILSRTTIQSMMGNQTGDLFGSDSGSYYGLAFGVLNQKGQSLGGQGSVGTFDWGGYFNTQFFADPREKIIGVLMKQTRSPVSDDTGWKFRLLVGQAVDD
jgi:CubicO group peptidase (beta-lactamase class C family)